MANYLADIIKRKKREAMALPQPILLKEALKQNCCAIIAEIKRRSPSKGLLNPLLDPVEQAQRYVLGGAAAISVLTDASFEGSLEDLRAVVQACPGTPILRKDFILDVKQLYETARAGAHAVLLIAKVLQQRLPEFIGLARSFGLETLVEVHDLQELLLVQQAGAQIIGVNNRDLSTFQVSLETALTLAPHCCPSIIKVAESGIEHPEHVALMRRAGYDAVLIGEALVKAQDPVALLKGFHHAG
jgi:indole-3-glycerol phosphate synthase